VLAESMLVVLALGSWADCSEVAKGIVTSARSTIWVVQ
jgi:hypothetical protein